MKIALTGTIGSGKSKVASFIRAYGYTVLDADIIAHDLYQPGSEVFSYLVSTYGEDILDDTGLINRTKLGHILFAHEENLKTLEAQIFPGVMNVINTYDAYHKPKILFAEVPLLFEANLSANFDQVWVVDMDDEARLDRLIKRGMTLSDIKRREKRQVSREYKLKHANYVIDNNESEEVLKTRVIELLKEVETCQKLNHD